MVDPGTLNFPASFWPPIVTINLNKYELDSNEDVISFNICRMEGGGSGCSETEAFVVKHPDLRFEVDEDTDFLTALDNDFALIFLPEPIDSIQPLELNSDSGTPAAEAELPTFGWGDTIPGEETNRPNLPQTVTLEALSNEVCASIIGDLANPENVLCAFDEGESSCQGDSGKWACNFFLRLTC